jgi:hypothetical protein
MKIFFAEVGPDYSSYLFPYQVLLLREKNDSLAKIYASGFLPFRNKENLFYLARSSRSCLKKFSLSSENRRILKRSQEVTSRVVDLVDFNYTFQVQRDCRLWAKERGWNISTRSIKHLFRGGFFNSLIVFQSGKKVVGYFIILKGKTFWHAAYPFYRPDFYPLGLGTRMLLESCILAHKEGASFCYLGSCYGQKGFYKRNMPGFEFFNGFSWSSNIDELKYLNERNQKDYLLRDKTYFERFYPGGLDEVIGKLGITITINRKA